MDDILLNYNKESEAEEAPPVPKKRKKEKKLSPKKLKRLQEKLEEEARIQAQLERERLLVETKERIQREWEFNKVKHKIFATEHEVRVNQLVHSFKKLNEIEEKWWEYKMQTRHIKEWKQYLKCNRLPDPSSLSEMNAYLFSWKEIEADETVPYCLKKTREVMELLEGLDKELIDPGPDCTAFRIAEWKKLRDEYRVLLQFQLDMTAYRIFRKVETVMTAIDIQMTKHVTKCPFFVMSLLAEYIMPVPSSKASEVKVPQPVEFTETDIKMVLPPILVDVHKALRALWLTYDHWSDRCRSFDCPPFPDYYRKDLMELTLDEFQSKLEVVDHRQVEELKTKKKIARIPPEHTVSQELLAWYTEPQRVLSDEVAVQEGEIEEMWRESVHKLLDEFEVNMRESSFLGGVLFLDMHYEPIQPKYLRYKFDVTLLTEAAILHPVDYYVKFPPPTPEQIFDEIGEPVPSPSIDLTAEKQKLVKVELKLPTTVLWLEIPMVANWDPNHKYWSVEDVHDIKYDAEEKTYTFLTGRLGLMGFFIPRYCNFLYQDWELMPDGEGCALFKLTTMKLDLEFKVQDHEVCLKDMVGAPTQDLDWLLGKFHTPLDLMQIMKKGGIDVFPPPDAACYIHNAVPKNVVGENHVYQIWGLFCLSFRYRHSRFNHGAGRRQMVFQMKEHHTEHETEFCLIRSSPADSCILEITEESEEYWPDPFGESVFYADLYNLITDNCTSAAKRKMETTSVLLVQTVRDLLAFIRPLSYS